MAVGGAVANWIVARRVRATLFEMRMQKERLIIERELLERRRDRAIESGYNAILESWQGDHSEPS